MGNSSCLAAALLLLDKSVVGGGVMGLFILLTEQRRGGGLPFQTKKAELRSPLGPIWVGSRSLLHASSKTAPGLACQSPLTIWKNGGQSITP